MRFKDQLVVELGPIRANALHTKATHFAKWMTVQPYLKANRHWLNNEGGYGSLVATLCCEALLHQDWYEGMRSYYNELAREYGYDRSRNKDISLEGNIDVVESLLGLLHEYHPWEEVASQGVLTRSDYTPLNGRLHIFLGYVDGLQPDKRTILWTWLETRSYSETADLLGCAPKKVHYAVKAATLWANRNLVSFPA